MFFWLKKFKSIYLTFEKSLFAELFTVKKDGYVEVEVSNHSGIVAVGVVPSNVDFYEKPIENENSNPGGKTFYTHIKCHIVATCTGYYNVEKQD